MYQNCKHEDLKYFEPSDHVVCLKCGRVFPETEEVIKEVPRYPLSQPPGTGGSGPYPGAPISYC